MKSKTIDLEKYQPLPVAYQLRYAILQKTRKGQDPLPDIQGREEVKKDVLRALLSGAHPYLVSEEGTGKTRLAKSLARLLPAIPVIRGCPYRDDPKWPKHLLCPRCQAVDNPQEEFGFDLIPGARRFSRIQGNEYTNEAKLLGLKDIQAIIQGKSPSDPEAFIGTGVFRANRGLLFIDELPAIRNKVQVLLHPVLEESKAILEEYNWEHHLDLIVIATGNPEGFSHVNEVPRPLLDRLELIYMGLPEESVERDIILREKFRLKDEFQLDSARDELINYPPLSELERRVISPWWITDIVNGAVRHSRTCSLLDKKASLRGSIRALDHTYATVELANRKVATLADAGLGLRLALRGRIRLRADLYDFDNPQESIRRTDRVTDDLLWNAFESFDLGFPLESGQFQDDVRSLVDSGLDNVTEKLPRYPELKRVVVNMKKAAREAATANLNPAEKEIFLHPDRAGKQLLEEYNRSAVDIMVNIAWHKKLLDDSALQQAFIPLKIQQGDF